MRRSRTFALGAIAVAAVAAGGATSASAAPPEFGRCVKVATGTGIYATGTCTSEGGEEKFEWLPGPGPRPGFTLSLKPKTAVTLKTTNNRGQVNCFGATGSGEVTGPTTVGNVTLTLTGCEFIFPCSTRGQNGGTVLLAGGTGTLGVIKAGETPLKDKTGLDLTIDAKFGCPEEAESFHLFGSVIGAISGHVMTTKRTWIFNESQGVQKPLMFEGGIPETLEWLDNGAPAQVGLWMPNLLLSEEKIEINTVV